jgi:hypothetical protein
MSVQPVRPQLCVLFFIIALASVCSAQKPDDWAMQNAQIGPDNPIEMRAGTSYDAQAMYPVPDGPLFPLKARVKWSIAPAVKGVSIDANLGKISVDSDVVHGTATVVHATVDGGRRKLEAKLYVFRPEENPLVGRWHVDANVACGHGQEIQAGVIRSRALHGLDWKFHVDQQFWVGREMNIAAGTRLSGSYELDMKAATIKLIPKWPASNPLSTWSYSLKDSGKMLLLHPLTDQEDLKPGCSYILKLR